METVSNALFWISNGLMVPVVILLLLFLLQAVILVCSYFGEMIRRRGVQKKVSDAIEGDRASLESRLSAITGNGRERFLKAIGNLLKHKEDRSYCERLVSQFEVDSSKELGGPRILAKVGPMLGLMGTLIPMGPALVGLASGDLATMAYNMQVAFATTVIGMLVAAIGVVTLQAKQRSLAGEMNDLEYINSVLGDETK